MGGVGSGNWFRYSKKSTVDESLTLAVSHVRIRAGWRMSGTLTWTSSRGHQSWISYFLTGTDDWPTINLSYRLNRTEDVTIPVRTQTTSLCSGGVRWWFTCPLIVGGVACCRRVDKLHLPPSAKYFGCRKCHELTYQSSQEAHQLERIMNRLGFDAEVGRMYAARLKSGRLG